MKTYSHEHWAIKPDILIQYRQLSKIPELKSATAIDDYEEGLRIPVRKVRDWSIVEVSGVLINKPTLFDIFLGAVSVNDLRLTTEALLEDNSTKGIIFDIDSPGGQVNGLVEFADWLFSAVNNTNKPVVSLISGLGASGAYWIASQTDEIYGQPSALVGSIGVITVIQDATRLEKNIGIDSYVIKTGKNKAIGVGQVTDEQIKLLEDIQSEYFNMFINAIERKRKINLTEEEKDGRVFLAKQTVKRLVDRIGTIDNIISDYKI